MADYTSSVVETRFAKLRFGLLRNIRPHVVANCAMFHFSSRRNIHPLRCSSSSEKLKFVFAARLQAPSRRKYLTFKNFSDYCRLWRLTPHPSCFATHLLLKEKALVSGMRKRFKFIAAGDSLLLHCSLLLITSPATSGLRLWRRFKLECKMYNVKIAGFLHFTF